MALRWDPSTSAKTPNAGAYRGTYRDASGRRVSFSYKAPKNTRAHRKAAELLLAEVLVEVERQKRGLSSATVNPEKLTAEQACDVWLERYGSRLAWASTARGYINKHVHGRRWASKQMEFVTEQDAQQFVDSLEVSASTARKIRLLMQGVYNRHRRLTGYRGPNPWADVDDPRGPSKQRVPLPSSKVWTLIEAATPQKRVWFLIAAFMGMRLGEICRIEGAHYDAERGVLRVFKTKANKPRLVPIHPEVAPHLVPLLEATDGLLWPSQRGATKGQPRTPDGGKLMRRTMERAGIKAEGVTFHSLRHTWATRFTECGGDRLARHAIGWGSRSGRVDEDVYTHLPVEFLKTELAKLHYPRPEGRTKEERDG